MGRSVVPLGLMNGARGVVVAILYCEDGEGRADGQPASSGYPRGREFALLLDLVIVYAPKTWVPVPSMTVRNDKSNFLSRTGIPLSLCWALAVHKSQGLTCPRRSNREHEFGSTWA